MANRGRPPVDEDLKRDEQVVVLLTKDEKRQLRDWAKGQAYGLGPIARALLLGAMRDNPR